jgi:ABC-type molybdenum transport system ATPase subunit/photorepair protein PhrA
MKIKLPQSNKAGISEELELTTNLVIVGANGSGKSRFGNYIEKNLVGSKRISAQRILYVENAPMLHVDEASNRLKNSHYRQPVTTVQNDSQIVLSALFAEISQRNADYVEASERSCEKLPIPDSAIGRLIKIWNEIFPHREIIFSNGKVEAKKKNSASY